MENEGLELSVEETDDEDEEFEPDREDDEEFEGHEWEEFEGHEWFDFTEEDLDDLDYVDYDQYKVVDDVMYFTEGLKELNIHSNDGKDLNKVRTVVIPKSVKTIDFHTFAGSDTLETVIIPAGVEELGDCLFIDDSNLKTVFIPESVTSVGVQMFDGTKNLTVYCGHKSKPDSWPHENEWTGRDCKNLKVVWNTKLSDIL